MGSVGTNLSKKSTDYSNLGELVGSYDKYDVYEERAVYSDEIQDALDSGEITFDIQSRDDAIRREVTSTSIIETDPADFEYSGTVVSYVYKDGHIEKRYRVRTADSIYATYDYE